MLQCKQPSQQVYTHTRTRTHYTHTNLVDTYVVTRDNANLWAIKCISSHEIHVTPVVSDFYHNMNSRGCNNVCNAFLVQGSNGKENIIAWVSSKKLWCHGAWEWNHSCDLWGAIDYACTLSLYMSKKKMYVLPCKIYIKQAPFVVMNTLINKFVTSILPSNFYYDHRNLLCWH